MMNTRIAYVLFVGFTLLSSSAPAQTPSNSTVSLSIDATDLPRKLLSANLKIPVDSTRRSEDGTIALWYPKWTPGTHGPGGPIANVAGMKINTPDGKRLVWERAVGEFYRVNVSVPEGVTELHVEIRYITNQPTVNSSGVDSYGSAALGFISPGTVLLYPDNVDIDDARIDLSVTLPAGWKASTALVEAGDSENSEGESEQSNSVHFKPDTIRAVVDCPIMCGIHRSQHELADSKAIRDGTKIVPHTLHIFSEAESVLKPHPDSLQKFRNMVTQSARLFGSHPFDRFDILLATTDVLGKNGLEHSRSTFNILGQRVLQEPARFKGWDRLLIPHEYIHSWCGKYRRPEGMVTGDFHSPKKMDMLWVYEGLTQYLGELIEARCGLMTPEEFRHRFATEIRRAMHQQGRDWRSLSDTGACSPVLRAGSNNWPRLRRSQDYYMEGMLFWLEADAIIRSQSDGAKSLDDFCQHFFAYNAGEGGDESSADPHPKGYDRAEVIQSLGHVLDFDWEGLIARRVDMLVERFDPAVVDRLGYSIQYSNEKPDIPSTTFRASGGVDLLDSIGAVISDSGKVTDLLLGSAADTAGLGPGMEIVGVNGNKWSKNRMHDAIAMSATTGEVNLMVVSGDSFQDFVVKYDGGPRYMTIVPKKNGKDLLAEILKAL